MRKKTIVILHGWRVPSTRYMDLRKSLEQSGYSVHVLDFPGFDGKKIPEKGYTLQNYAQFLDSYCKTHKLSDVVLLCHSFGGRVAVKYLSLYTNKHVIKSLILTGTPLVKENFSPRKLVTLQLFSYIRLFANFIPVKVRALLQERMRFFLYRMIGEYDYYKAGGLKKTLTNILEEKTEKYLGFVKVPTLIIWGANDTITPLSIAIAIHQKISSSKIIVIENGTHKLPYENAHFFASTVDNFLKEL